MKYHPKSMMFYFSLILLLSFFTIAFYVALMILLNGINIGDLMTMMSFVAAISAIGYIIYIFIRVAKRSIVLHDERIFVSKDIGSLDNRLQYKLDIRISDITGIYMNIDTKNSLNKNMKFVITPMPNIVLQLNDGQEARINMYYYSKNQSIEIIDHIIDMKKKLDPSFSNASGKELIMSLKNSKT